MNIAQEAAQMSGYKKKEINGKSYQLRLLPATHGLILGNKLAKLFGTSIGVMVDGDTFDGTGMCTNIAIALTGALDKIDIVEIIKQLTDGIYCNDHKIEFDTHFAGNYGELVAVVEFALRENFGDFFLGYLKSKGMDEGSITRIWKEAMSPKKEETSETLVEE